jgi:hypothetical protein
MLREQFPIWRRITFYFFFSSENFNFFLFFDLYFFPQVEKKIVLPNDYYCVFFFYFVVMHRFPCFEKKKLRNEGEIFSQRQIQHEKKNIAEAGKIFNLVVDLFFLRPSPHKLLEYANHMRDDRQNNYYAKEIILHFSSPLEKGKKYTESCGKIGHKNLLDIMNEDNSKTPLIWKSWRRHGKRKIVCKSIIVSVFLISMAVCVGVLWWSMDIPYCYPNMHTCYYIVDHTNNCTIFLSLPDRNITCPCPPGPHEGSFDCYIPAKPSEYCVSRRCSDLDPQSEYKTITCEVSVLLLCLLVGLTTNFLLRSTSPRFAFQK